MKLIKKLHEQVRDRIIKQTEKYKKQANNTKNQQLLNKVICCGISPRVDGPFKELQRITENAFKIELLDDYGISVTFNVFHLLPYYDEGEQIFRINFFDLQSNFFSTKGA